MFPVGLSGTFVIPYVVPLFLGMTYDARTSKPGVDIFDGQYVDNPQVISNRHGSSLYKVITNKSDLLEELGMSGDLALKVKSGYVNIAGKGSYLKNNKNSESSIIILTKMKYTAVVKALSSEAKPRDGWVDAFNLDILGTHFVSSITYGVEIIASAKFVVHNSSELEDIRGKVVSAISSQGEGNKIDADGRLHKLTEDIKNKASLEISYYATVPIKSVPNTIDGLKDLINSFQQQVIDANLTDGVPMSVTLTPLTEIAADEDDPKFEFDKNEDLMDRLSDLDANMDDLVVSRLKLEDYAKTLPFDIKEETRNQIGSMLMNITNILQVHYKTVWALNLTEGPEQLQAGFDAYGRPLASRKYLRLVEQLISDTSKGVDRNAFVSTDTYIHWGNVTCTGNNEKLLYKGFTFSSSEDGIGGSSQYNCAPPDLTTYDDLNPNPKSTLSAIKYTEFSENGNPFKGFYANVISGRGVPCAKCYSPESASITMFSAADTCPVSWELLYKGYLMSSRLKDGYTTEYICVDELPSKPFEYNYPKAAANTLSLTTVRSKGALPSNIYTENALVRCVVCAMKSQNTL